jgi:hypothetical protein
MLFLRGWKVQPACAKPVLPGQPTDFAVDFNRSAQKTKFMCRRGAGGDEATVSTGRTALIGYRPRASELSGAPILRDTLSAESRTSVQSWSISRLVRPCRGTAPLSEATTAPDESRTAAPTE